jgi:hypothetical protein
MVSKSGLINGFWAQQLTIKVTKSFGQSLGMLDIFGLSPFLATLLIMSNTFELLKGGSLHIISQSTIYKKLENHNDFTPYE